MIGAAASLAAARRLGVEGVAWFGSWRGLEGALATACPEARPRLVDAGGAWPALVEALQGADEDTVFVWSGVHEPARELRVRLATARVGSRALMVMLRPTVPTPGLWVIEPAPGRGAGAVQSGATDSDGLAALLGAEPQALTRARRLIAAGAEPDALRQRIEAAADPAAEVARIAFESGEITAEQVVHATLSAEALRGLWMHPAVVARRADLSAQIGWALTHTPPRRRFWLAPTDRPIVAADAALWSLSGEGARQWAVDPRWPLVFRHPHLLIGLVRAAEADPRGALWWRLAQKAPELPFSAPALGWARRYAAIDPDGGHALLAARFQEAVARAATRGDFAAVGELIAAWRADLPADSPYGWGAVKAALLAALVGDDLAVLEVEPAVVGARSPAIEAELLRLRGMVLRRAGYLREAELDLRAALALELRWGRARDLAPWSSLVRPHDTGAEAPQGAAVTRVALATLLSEGGRLDEARALLAPLKDDGRPSVQAAYASLAAAAEDWPAAVDGLELAVHYAAGDPPLEARMRARLASLLRRLGDLARAREEARLAWAACLVGAPVHRRLTVALVVVDLLDPEAQVALEASVLAELDRLPPRLPARRAWEARLRAGRVSG